MIPQLADNQPLTSTAIPPCGSTSVFSESSAFQLGQRLGSLRTIVQPAAGYAAVSLIGDVASLTPDTKNCGQGIISLTSASLSARYGRIHLDLILPLSATQRRTVMTENLKEIELDVNIEELEAKVAPDDTGETVVPLPKPKKRGH